MRWRRIIMVSIVSLVIGNFAAGIENGYKIIDEQNLGGDILYVGGSGEGNYTSIQEAINAASNGDTIFVYNGMYKENVVIDKSINLIGESIDETIIDGNRSNDVIRVEAGNVKIANFTIQYSGRKENMAGIYIVGSYCRIENCKIIKNNRGIYMISDNNVIRDCSINICSKSCIAVYGGNHNNFNNLSLSSAGWCGIYIWGGNSIIENCSIRDCGTRGIYLYNGGHNTIKNCVITDTQIHGITLLLSDNNVITNCSFSSHKYFGIYLNQSNSNLISKCESFENKISGVFIKMCSQVVVEECNIVNNKDSGIQIISSDNIFINNNNIYSNNKLGIFGMESYADARHNYWGSMLGPFLGDKIQRQGGWIYFFPWKLKEIQ